MSRWVSSAHDPTAHPPPGSYFCMAQCALDVRRARSGQSCNASKVRRKRATNSPRQYCATCMHQVCWRPVNSLRPQESIAVSSRESAARSYHNLQFKLNAALSDMAVISALCDVRRICAGQNSQSLLFHNPLAHNLYFFIPLSLIISTSSYPISLIISTFSYPISFIISTFSYPCRS